MFVLTELRRAPGTGAPGTPETQQHRRYVRAEGSVGPLAPSERSGAATPALSPVGTEGLACLGQPPSEPPNLVLERHLHKEGGGWVLVSVL